MKLKLHSFQGQAGLVHRWGFGGNLDPSLCPWLLTPLANFLMPPKIAGFINFILISLRLEPNKKQCEFIIKICQLQFQLLQ